MFGLEVRVTFLWFDMRFSCWVRLSIDFKGLNVGVRD